MGIAWQRSTLPEPCGSSTIDAGGLNGRVRDGNAWVPSAIITKRVQHGVNHPAERGLLFQN